MTTTTSPATVTSTRVDDIAAQIRAACSPVLGMDSNTRDAKDAATDASNAASSGREAIMVTLASLSHAGGWTDAEIRAAAGKAAGMSNNATDKALATFIGETKRAMHPNACAHVPNLVILRDRVWEDEVLAYTVDKSTPTPCKKAFVRKYHMMITMFGEAADGRVMTTPEHVLAYAAEHNPDHDAAKVLKQIEGLSSKLAAIYANFAVDELQVATQALADITKKMLETSAVDKDTANTSVERPLAPVPAVVAERVAAAKATTTVVPQETGDVAAGAVDLLDDILGGGSDTDASDEGIRLAA